MLTHQEFSVIESISLFYVAPNKSKQGKKQKTKQITVKVSEISQSYCILKWALLPMHAKAPSYAIPKPSLPFNFIRPFFNY